MDSGANVILFHQLLKGIKLHAGEINIATASNESTMRINQKADLQLQSETGTLIEFTDAYHYNDLQDNLMSVGIACDAGLIMIFDKKKLCVYQETNFKVSGNLISTVKRDATTGNCSPKKGSAKAMHSPRERATSRAVTGKIPAQPPSLPYVKHFLTSSLFALEPMQRKVKIECFERLI